MNTPAPPRAWRDRAACLSADPDAFFPDKRNNSAAIVKRMFCKGCPVETQCLEWALHNDEEGVWGNTTDKERKKLRKKLKKKAAA